MLRRTYILIVLGLLAACSPLTLYYKEGAPVERLTRDEATCRTEALRILPVDTRTRIVPGTMVPQTICDGAGNCQTVWVKTSPDRIETYDANAGARAQYVESCMGEKGYQRVRLPACSDDIVAQTRLAPTTVMPAITQNSCAIRFQTGQWQVVTPPE